MRKPFWVKGSQYWYIEKDGKQVRLSKLGDKDPDGATRKNPPPAVMNEWHRLVRDGVPEDMRVGDVFEQFMATIEGEDIAKSTNHHLTHFRAFVGPERKVSKLRPIDLDRFIERKPHWSESTKRTFANRVLAAINWAVRKGLIPSNPITATPGFKRPGRFTRRRGVVKAELRVALESAAGPAFGAFLVGLRESGARPSELRRMLIEKCDVEKGFAAVPNKTEHQTGKEERVIYFSEGMKTLVAGLIGGRKAGNVFLTKSGKKWSHTNLQRHWERLKKKVPVPDGISVYSYRRSFISAAINDANINPTVVATLVGHANLEMIMRHYYDADPKAMKDAMRRITELPPESKG